MQSINPSNARLLNTQPKQTPDEIFNGPAVTVNAFAPIPMKDGTIRLAFAEQVFPDGKFHFRTAVQLQPDAFNFLLEALLKLKHNMNPDSEKVKANA